MPLSSVPRHSPTFDSLPSWPPLAQSASGPSRRCRGDASSPPAVQRDNESQKECAAVPCRAAPRRATPHQLGTTDAAPTMHPLAQLRRGSCFVRQRMPSHGLAHPLHTSPTQVGMRSIEPRAHGPRWVADEEAGGVPLVGTRRPLPPSWPLWPRRSRCSSSCPPASRPAMAVPLASHK